MNMMIRMLTSAHASSYEQCSWWKDKKSCKRKYCIRDNLDSDQNQAKSPWSMDLKLQTHYLLTPTYYEQYSRWKAKRQKQKQICPAQSEIDNTWELVQYMDHTISQSMGMKMQNPHYLSCTSPKANLGK